MKKYNKLTTLVLLITLAFTSFFIWKAQAASPNPKVNIVTIEGSAEHLKPIQLHARISDNQVYGDFPIFKLEENKVQYLDDQPFLQRVDGNLNSFTDKLISEHRSFMRGKSRRADQYIVTNDWVVYTAMATDVYWQDSVENQLNISILNKQTKEEVDFSIDLGDDVNYFNLHTAQLNYPELSIAMTKLDSNGEAENLISTFDFKNPEAELTDRINFTDKIKQDEYFYVGNSFDKTARFIPFQSFKTTQTVDEIYDDIYTDSHELTGYFVYDIVERKFIDIPLFEESKTLLLTDRDKIYVAEDLGETLDFYEVNIDTMALEAMRSIQMASNSIGRDQLHSYSEFFNQNMTIFDGKLYTYEQQEYKGSDLPIFQVIDLEKNETLFLGRLDASEGSKINSPNISVFEYRLNPAAN